MPGLIAASQRVIMDNLNETGSFSYYTFKKKNFFLIQIFKFKKEAGKYPI